MDNTGSAMDRRIERPRIDRRWRWIAAAVGLVALLLIGWRLIPSSGSADVAAADIETGTVTRDRFEDYLPVRATVAPNVTTFVGAVSGGQDGGPHAGLHCHR